MGTVARKVRKLRRIVAANDGPTPERLTKGDYVEQIEAPESERTNRNAVQKVTRIVVSRSLEHLYHLGALNYAQWFAGFTYREWKQDGWPEPRQVADYGTRVGGGGEPSPVPLTHKAEVARQKLKALQAGLSAPHRQAIEAIIAGEHQNERGRARMARLSQLREALTAAAVVLKVA